MHTVLKHVRTTLLLVAVVAAGLTPGPWTSPATAQPAGPANAQRAGNPGGPQPTYSAGWMTQDNVSASGNTLAYTGQAGASARYTFTGVSVKVFTKMGPGAGIMDVYLDGAKVRSFDTYAPTHRYGVVAYETSDLALGTHTIEVRRANRVNPNASAGGYVHLDHIDTTDRPGAQAFADLAFGLFVHHGINTYTGVAGGQSNPRNEPSTAYRPTDFSPGQWASAAQEAGMRYLIYTVKHHSGWSGYPTAYGDTPRYDVTTSSTPNLDPLARTVAAARQYGLTPVLYYSCWDKYNFYNLSATGGNDNDQHVEFVKNQLTELLDGRYGDIPVLWMDICDERQPGKGFASTERLAEIVAHAKQVRPGLVVVTNVSGTAPPLADLRNYESDEAPQAGSLHPATTDRSTTIGGDTVCATGPTGGWWVFGNTFNPICKGWTRDRALTQRAFLNERNSTYGLNVPPGPNGRLAPGAEAFLRSLAPADDRSGSIVYTGSWNQRAEAPAYRGTLMSSSSRAAKATYTFTGTSVAIETKLGPGSGIMDIHIDGVLVASFDSWSPSELHRAIAYQDDRLSPGQHTVTVTPTERQNPNSAGKAVHVDSIQGFTWDARYAK